MKVKQLKEWLSRHDENLDVAARVSDLIGKIDNVFASKDTLFISATCAEDEDDEYDDFPEDAQESDYIATGHIVTEQELQDEQAIVKELEARGFRCAAKDDHKASIYRLDLGEDRLYEFYIEPWEWRYCAKYNLIINGGDQDFEWHKAEPVFQWFKDNPEIRAN